GVGARLRQAHVVVRIPHHRPRRQRNRRHGQPRARRHAAPEDREARGVVPGRGVGPADAGDRRRAADPHWCRGGRDQGGEDARRDRVPYRGGGTGGGGGAAQRRRGGERGVSFIAPVFRRVTVGG